MYPRGNRGEIRVRTVGFEGEVFACPTVDDDFIRIRGRFGFMHDDGGRGAEFRRHFVFVGPAPVIGHALALEHRRIELSRIVGVWDRRIVDQHHQRLAPQIGTFVVVPAKLRRDDAITDEDHLRVIDPDVALGARRERYKIGREIEWCRFAACIECKLRRGRHASHRHPLHISAIRIAARQPESGELLFYVGDGQGFSPGAGRAPLEFIRGQHLDVLQQVRAIDGFQ